VISLIGQLAGNWSDDSPKVFWKTRFETPADTGQLSIFNIEDYLDRPVDHARKQDKILRLLGVRLMQDPFAYAGLILKEIRAIGITDFAELMGWMEALQKGGLLESEHPLLTRKAYLEKHASGTPFARLTPEGWARFSELFGTASGQNCFVAMSYKLPDNTAVRQAIVEACRSTGWEAIIADEQQHLDGVTDRIIADINRSRFVVADLTGHRTGVYFEAGYAVGLGRPVIYTVRQDNAKDVHFDIQHYPRIEWQTPLDLQERLTARIGALINR
jgi:hypothetical protein